MNAKTDSTHTERVPLLARDGDEFEKGHWEQLRKSIPHYEEFWRVHVFPLRVPNQIWLRDQLDPQFEALAIVNYSTFVALGRARQRIFAHAENYKYIEELYAALQRSCELGIKLIHRFDELYESFTTRHSGISTADLEGFVKSRLNEYRNLLHDEMISTPKEDKERRLIPKLEKLSDYRMWTSVMYHMNRSDFVIAADQLKTDFASTCSRLENAWNGMCSASADIIGLRDYLERRCRGIAVALVSSPTTISGARFIISSSG